MFKIATSGRPVPFWSIFPGASPPVSFAPPSLSKLRLLVGRWVSPNTPYDPRTESVDTPAITQAADMISRAQRLIIYAENCTLPSSLSPPLFAQLSEIGNIPITMSLQGLGALDDSSEQSLDMFSVHDSAYASLVMQKTDRCPRHLIRWLRDG